MNPAVANLHPAAGAALRCCLSIMVTEDVKNDNKLGRVYNMVQHATIGPPFLDENTLVDSNAARASCKAARCRIRKSPLCTGRRR